MVNDYTLSRHGSNDLLDSTQQTSTYDHRTKQSSTPRQLSHSRASAVSGRFGQRQHHPQAQHHPGLHPPGHSRSPRHGDQMGDKDMMRHSNMAIPAIEITKDTPSESINPIESYSEEEFETSMKTRAGPPPTRGYPTSPLPPHRTRVMSDYERSNLGRVDHIAPGVIRKGPSAQQLPHERGVRWFVALFDYDPLTMSPNPDGADEELPFQEGQLIKVMMMGQSFI